MKWYSILFASALTHLHPGMGRSPGVVDLPVIKDPIGIPFIPASELKGSLKTFLANKHGCLTKLGNEYIVNCNPKEGSDKCKRICCLLGADKSGEEGSSALVITDMYPLLIPVPSLDKGIVFVTSPTLLARVLTLSTQGSSKAQAVMKFEFLRGLLEDLHKEIDQSNPILITRWSENREEEVSITLTKFKATTRVCEKLIHVIEKILETTNNPARALNLDRRILIVDDSIVPTLIERTLVRVTRVRLDRQTKTVARGALWTEEYIPHMTLFVGFLLDSGFRNQYCNSNLGQNGEELWELLDSDREKGTRCFSLVVGGKETIGKGLVRICAFEEN